MKCRVIFPSATSFRTPKEFLEYTKGILKAVRDDGYSANFFLFGEDMFGVYSLWDAINSSERRDGEFDHRDQVLKHEEIRDFINKKIRECTKRANNFLILSLYVYLPKRGNEDAPIVNFVYIVGRNLHFALKRVVARGDKKCFPEQTGKWHHYSSETNPKSDIQVKIGGKNLKIKLLVCRDITLLPEMKWDGYSIIFVPAYGLPTEEVEKTVPKINGKGRIFINDPADGVIWDIPLGTGMRVQPKPIAFDGHKYLSLPFEIT